MSLRIKNIIYTLVLLSLVALVYVYRHWKKEPMVAFNGKTMGPIAYHIKYFDDKKRNFQPQVDSLLKVFNQSLNTYIDQSEISRFNRDSAFTFQLPYFYPVLEASKKIYEMTGGAYDPTVMPLVNAWGFGPNDTIKPDSAVIDSLQKIVGFKKLNFDKLSISKTDRRMQLDFSASAKGYGVDVVLDFLRDQGLKNVFVEIGGEVRALGENMVSDVPWTVGILDPGSDEVNQFYLAEVQLSNKAMATSGNYFNYHYIDGIRYSHTIDPSTGYPIIHPLLSASVFASNCLEADALATAFMVMGHEKAIRFLEKHTEYEAFLIFDGGNNQMTTYATSGIRGKIKILNNDE